MTKEIKRLKFKLSANDRLALHMLYVLSGRALRLPRNHRRQMMKTGNRFKEPKEFVYLRPDEVRFTVELLTIHSQAIEEQKKKNLTEDPAKKENYEKLLDVYQKLMTYLKGPGEV